MARRSKIVFQFGELVLRKRGGDIAKILATAGNDEEGGKDLRASWVVCDAVQGRKRVIGMRDPLPHGDFTIGMNIALEGVDGFFQ